MNAVLELSVYSKCTIIVVHYLVCMLDMQSPQAPNVLKWRVCSNKHGGHTIYCNTKIESTLGRHRLMTNKIIVGESVRLSRFLCNLSWHDIFLQNVRLSI